ncbi:MAG TPA: GntR family transcriptional regulator [Beijerinckiaceae bacterium]|jgi:GntR family transcriptional regulator of vanillate catabolism|nr:GntR family transcriptional regulator [Beijerinckiaceae bacterium]
MKHEADVLQRLRDMILQGDLAPGQRVPEAHVAALLGLSRTPVRQALPVLAKEGLLVPAGARGFAVRAFTKAEIAEGVDARGLLEGYAAHVLAQRGMDPETKGRLQDLLAQGDVIFAKRHLVAADERAYGEMNRAFHDTIVEAARLPIVKGLLETLNRIPFASPEMIAFDRLGLEEMYDALWYSHRQHHQIVGAIAAGEGARAENLFREHVNNQIYSMSLRGEDNRRSPMARLEPPVNEKPGRGSRKSKAPEA